MRQHRTTQGCLTHLAHKATHTHPSSRLGVGSWGSLRKPSTYREVGPASHSSPPRRYLGAKAYRGTSLTRKRTPLGPYLKPQDLRHRPTQARTSRGPPLGTVNSARVPQFARDSEHGTTPPRARSRAAHAGNISHLWFRPRRQILHVPSKYDGTYKTVKARIWP